MKKNAFLTVTLLCALLTSLFAQHAKTVTSVSMTVRNLEKSIEFYSQVLGFTNQGEYTIDGTTTGKLFNLPGNTHALRVARMTLGNEQIELMEFLGSREGRSIPSDSKSNDQWFQHIAIVVSDMEAAYAMVRDAKVTHVSTAPQTLPDYIPAAAGISAFYFRDPDGHNLELIHFPAGKGNPKWQSYSAGQLFLGIDHTAIGIEDTESAIGFYTEDLGLIVGGRSENYGTEQEHLNQVFGARLLITGLHATSGIGIEFLDYIAPPRGRNYPADTTPLDLWHWHTTIDVDDLEGALRTIVEDGYQVVSRATVERPGEVMILVRDKDSHAIMLREAGKTAGSM